MPKPSTLPNLPRQNSAAPYRMSLVGGQSWSWALPLLFAALWFCSTRVASSMPTLRGARICLLIAHPDDEAMFFAPTLLALAKPDLGNSISILCLSSGDADGLGGIRKKELVKSAVNLGVRDASLVTVVEDADFPDSMISWWETDKVRDVLLQRYLKRTPGQIQSEPSFDSIMTFDSEGVSSHPNHKSLYHGAQAFVKSLQSGRSGAVSLYTLTSVNIFRKYLSLLDAPFSLLSGLADNRGTTGLPSRLVFVSSPGAYRTAQLAMTQAHESQMRWFRWGWITVSRYMVVNDLREVSRSQ